MSMIENIFKLKHNHSPAAISDKAAAVHLPDCHTGDRHHLRHFPLDAVAKLPADGHQFTGSRHRKKFEVMLPTCWKIPRPCRRI